MSLGKAETLKEAPIILRKKLRSLQLWLQVISKKQQVQTDSLNFAAYSNNQIVKYNISVEPNVIKFCGEETIILSMSKLQDKETMAKLVKRKLTMNAELQGVVAFRFKSAVSTTA